MHILDLKFSWTHKTAGTGDNISAILCVFDVVVKQLVLPLKINL